jgi:hypothetical protein
MPYDKIINKEDIESVVNFIKYYKLVEEQHHDKLLWKDFLLYFKKASHGHLDKMYTGKLGIILIKLLNIDQELHIRKGIKLTFKEWLEKN